MSKTRDNHYVPQWYQRDFFPPRRSTLRYLDLLPKTFLQPDGSSKPGKALFDWPPSKCFYQTDLYSTRFLFHIDDEIERKLFGDIDGRGSAAVRAFQTTNAAEWVRRFNDLFEYIDAQRLRTPKGLDWLQTHYPALDQNRLMFEMQRIRMLNITLWSECVKEIVSAEGSETKFILTDHPVTTYNHAVPPDDPRCAYPDDPPIAWKATQTLFPLSQNLCLILTNLEYAQDPDLSDPCAKRTNARNYRPALVRADHFIRTRRLTAGEVQQVNTVLKLRARRYVAAGDVAWLHPAAASDWGSLRNVLMPPSDHVGMFGGETFIGFDDGRVEHRDAFGRTEARPNLLSTAKTPQPKANADPCGCGSGRPYGTCCAKRPAALRPSWAELSIRERNILHFNAITQILDLGDGEDWVGIRRSLTAEKISEIYRVFRALWPEDTDLISLLPKPDGRLRALFSGIIDLRTMAEYAFGTANQFGEVLIQNPFLRDAHVAEAYSPIDNPEQYQLEAIKGLALLIELMPLVDAGLVNLFPDPSSFDPHLRAQMMHMAKDRLRLSRREVEPDIRTKWLAEDDMRRALLFLPKEHHRATIREAMPGIDDRRVAEAAALVRDTRHLDPLAPLNQDLFKPGRSNGLLTTLQLAPNFEISLYLAQATGSVIVTDNPHRWRELLASSGDGSRTDRLPGLAAAMERESHVYLREPTSVLRLHRSGADAAYRALMADICRYLAREVAGRKPNWESQLPRRLLAANAALRKAVRAIDPSLPAAKVKCIAPVGGIREDTVSRLLLMTGVEHHTDSMSMAFFVERPDPSIYDRPFLSHSWER